LKADNGGDFKIVNFYTKPFISKNPLCVGAKKDTF
jgi:hypothetical protein